MKAFQDPNQYDPNGIFSEEMKKITASNKAQDNN
jgi:hypothetical protein